MYPSAFEPAFPGSEQAQTRGLDRTATRIGCESGGGGGGGSSSSSSSSSSIVVICDIYKSVTRLPLLEQDG